jgi:erythrin-vacuolar iron transport family protein
LSVATGIAIGVVLIELAVIMWIRHRYMETPVFTPAVQVALGGAVVFATGVLIGSL